MLFIPGIQLSGEALGCLGSLKWEVLCRRDPHGCTFSPCIFIPADMQRVSGNSLYQGYLY